jgi:hypothetical protein
MPPNGHEDRMPPKQNPLKLNPLQLRTLTLLQALARIPSVAMAGPGAGEATIQQFPQAHGDHFHLGDAVVRGSDATGLYNEKVWHALERKGVARADWPHRITLTAEGLTYDTGLADQILHRNAGH